MEILIELIYSVFRKPFYFYHRNRWAILPLLFISSIYFFFYPLIKLKANAFYISFISGLFLHSHLLFIKTEVKRNFTLIKKSRTSEEYLLSKNATLLFLSKGMITSFVLFSTFIFFFQNFMALFLMILTINFYAYYHYKIPKNPHKESSLLIDL